MRILDEREIKIKGVISVGECVCGEGGGVCVGGGVCGVGGRGCGRMLGRRQYSFISFKHVNSHGS